MCSINDIGMDSLPEPMSLLRYTGLLYNKILFFDCFAIDKSKAFTVIRHNIESKTDKRKIAKLIIP